MKRVLCLLIAVLLLAGGLWAAGQKEKAAPAPSPAPTPAAAQKASIRLWAVNASEVPLNPKEIEAWKTVEARTNTDMKWEFISSLAETKDQKFNLMMVSGDIADVVAYFEGQGGHQSINRYGQEGAFIALEDLIQKHAPNLKKILLDDPLIREAVQAQDGHLYFIPMLSALNAARGWFIRSDWLQKLGLSAPRTTAELYNVLVAFRDRDPNGNGQKDEIPMIARRRGDDWFYNIAALAYAFDADVEWVDRGGKVAYGPSEPQYKDYLAYIQRLYVEKLLDQEVLTRKGNPRDELLGKNVTGCLHDWFASTADLVDKLGKTIPGFSLKHFPPPLGSVKKPYTRIQMSKVRTDGGWSISAKNKAPVETIKMMDFLYSEEGQRLTNFGTEGVHYRMVDGKPKYTELITKNPNGLGMHEALVSAGCQWKIGMIQSIDYESQFANAVATVARLDYMKNYIVDEFPVLSFTETENEVLKDKYSQIRTYASEMSARTMVGELKAEDFDKVAAEMRKMGLEEVTRIYQAAYERKMKR